MRRGAPRSGSGCPHVALLGAVVVCWVAAAPTVLVDGRVTLNDLVSLPTRPGAPLPPLDPRRASPVAAEANATAQHHPLAVKNEFRRAEKGNSGVVAAAAADEAAADAADDDMWATTWTTTTTTTSTRHIQGVVRELARRLSASFGKGFRSQEFPCDESEHRSDYWADRTRLPDTWDNRRRHVMDTLAYLQGLFERYSIGPWWICSGTLLGSIRDGAFIPWDSDADISITWSTFDQLRALAQSMDIDPRFALDLFPEGCFGTIDMAWVSKYGLGGRLWDTHSGFYVDIFTWKPLTRTVAPVTAVGSGGERGRGRGRGRAAVHGGGESATAADARALRGGAPGSSPRTTTGHGDQAAAAWKYNLDLPFPFAGMRNSHVSFMGAPGWNSSTYMWFVPQEVVFRPGSQRTANCTLDNLTLPCPVDSDWWLRHEYGNDYLTPDHDPYFSYAYAATSGGLFDHYSHLGGRDYYYDSDWDLGDDGGDERVQGDSDSDGSEPGDDDHSSGDGGRSGGDVVQPRLPAQRQHNWRRQGSGDSTDYDPSANGGWGGLLEFDDGGGGA